MDVTEYKTEQKHNILQKWLILFALVAMLLSFTGCINTDIGTCTGNLFTQKCWEEFWTDVTEVMDRAIKAGQHVDQHSQVYQILLIGSDRREANWNGNSDTMILLSINKEKQMISMISFMRDLGVNIPGYGYNKINYAYAIGGGDLLVRTIEQNFQIVIDNYVAIDFNGMVRLIDIFGGVILDVTETEILVINEYISEVCRLDGLDPNAYYLSEPGVQYLNGVQALSYSRNRKTGRYDFDRTLRQRRVLEQLLATGKALSPQELLPVAMQILGLITHNLSAEQLNNLITLAPQIKNYALITDRIPYDGLYQSNNENLDPFWPETIERLHAVLY